MEVGELEPQLLARHRVEMGERLVEKYHARLGRERACEREPAPLIEAQGIRA